MFGSLSPNEGVHSLMSRIDPVRSLFPGSLRDDTREWTLVMKLQEPNVREIRNVSSIEELNTQRQRRQALGSRLPFLSDLIATYLR